jgi:hypothetical protein
MRRQIVFPARSEGGNMRAAGVVFVFLLFAFFLGSQASAGEHLAIKIGKLGDRTPFTVEGWRYRLMNNGIHMHFCDSSACQPGSKVSYVVMPPKKNYTFAHYKEEREKIARTLRKMAPAGTRIKFAEPERTEDKLFRIFKTRREVAAPDGKTTAFLSWLLMTDKVTFDFISSASDLKKAEEQLAPFMVAGMMVAVRDK